MKEGRELFKERRKKEEEVEGGEWIKKRAIWSFGVGTVGANSKHKKTKRHENARCLALAKTRAPKEDHDGERATNDNRQ